MVGSNRGRRSRPARLDCSARVCECNEGFAEVHEQRRDTLHVRAPMTASFLARWSIVGALSLMSVTAAGAGGRELRVCADPNNLPFSNAKGEGFENKIAEL